MKRAAKHEPEWQRKPEFLYLEGTLIATFLDYILKDQLLTCSAIGGPLCWNFIRAVVAL